VKNSVTLPFISFELRLAFLGDFARRSTSCLAKYSSSLALGLTGIVS
jgi:hypothetical protein